MLHSREPRSPEIQSAPLPSWAKHLTTITSKSVAQLISADLSKTMGDAMGHPVSFQSSTIKTITRAEKKEREQERGKKLGRMLF